VEDIKAPALFIFSPDDRVVRPDLTRDVAKRWGGDAQILEITDSEDEYNHVLAGDIMSPGTTAEVTEAISSWISGL